MSNPTPARETEARRLSRTSMALHLIRRGLVDLTYPPGSTFTEAELATGLKLSKTPIREALLMLSVDGLVQARPGAGYRVLPITLKDIRGMFAHWRRLEGDAVEKLVSSGVSANLAMAVSDVLSGEDEFEATGLMPDEVRRFVAFHSTLVYFTEDDFLGRDFSRLELEIERMLRLVVPHDGEELLADTPELMRLLVGSSPSQTRKAVLDHLQRVERLVVERLLDSDVLMATNVGFPTGRTQGTR